MKDKDNIKYYIIVALLIILAVLAIAFNIYIWLFADCQTIKHFQITYAPGRCIP